MQTLHVELGDRRYPIFIGSQLDPQQLLEPYIKGKQVMIVTNTTVQPLYLKHYVDAISALGKKVETCVLADGEKYKNIEHLNLIFNALLEAGFKSAKPGNNGFSNLGARAIAQLRFAVIVLISPLCAR